DSWRWVRVALGWWFVAMGWSSSGAQGLISGCLVTWRGEVVYSARRWVMCAVEQPPVRDV
ncbi:MAG: hypothetical protein IKL97_07350, partial [Eggerthellaceae bacterium]|nr:hypothetical protein [Eggerthellaceae bacterium]